MGDQTTFNKVRDRLVEDGVRRTYERALGREILIDYGTVWRNGSSHETSFDPPIRARIVETSADNLTRWMDDRHLDPVWNVEVIDHHHHLDDDLALYDVYGMGWNAEKGFEKAPCNEWRFVACSQDRVYLKDGDSVLAVGEVEFILKMAPNGDYVNAELGEWGNTHFKIEFEDFTRKHVLWDGDRLYYEK